MIFSVEQIILYIFPKIYKNEPQHKFCGALYNILLCSKHLNITITIWNNIYE